MARKKSGRPTNFQKIIITIMDDIKKYIRVYVYIKIKNRDRFIPSQEYYNNITSEVYQSKTIYTYDFRGFYETMDVVSAKKNKKTVLEMAEWENVMFVNCAHWSRGIRWSLKSERFPLAICFQKGHTRTLYKQQNIRINQVLLEWWYCYK